MRDSRLTTREVANKEFVARVGKLVCGQVSHLPKGLATPWVVTHTRSLAGVNPFVPGKVLKVK